MSVEIPGLPRRITVTAGDQHEIPLPSYAGSYRYAIRIWARCGQRERITQLLRTSEQSLRDGSPVSGFAAAIAASYVEGREGMYRWLEYAFRMREWQLCFVNGDPEFAPYRGEPRFQALLQQVGMRP